MISINTNYGGLFASKAASQSQRMLDTAMERLSTGKRINYATDDAAGQAIAVRLQAEIEGIAMATRNVADAQSLMDTADGALAETSNILLRMRELAVQASTGTLNSDDNAALDAEFQQLEAEIDRIASSSKWAGSDLFTGTARVFHIGTKATDTLSHTIGKMAAHDLGVDSLGADNASGGTNADADIDADLTDATKAAAMITAVDNAIKLVSTERGKLGALSNRLSSTITNLDQVRVNLSASQGRIEDADFAEETSNLAKGQILQQAATAMLAQANASKQTVLALVR